MSVVPLALGRHDGARNGVFVNQLTPEAAAVPQRNSVNRGGAIRAKTPQMLGLHRFWGRQKIGFRMTITIRRKGTLDLVNLRPARLAVLFIALFVAACVAQAAQYRLVPGVRDHALEIPLDPPIAPGGDVAAYQAAAQQAMNLTSEELGLPADMTPEMLFAMQSGGPAVAADALPLGPMVDPAAPPPVGQAPAGKAITPLFPSDRFISFLPGPAASNTAFRSQSAIDNLRAAICLSTAIYYEAASESDAGQRAVAQVVLNRVRHPAYPNTVCGVVFQGTERGDRLCQFSFACDGSMRRTPPRAAWLKARRIADEALAGYIFAPVGYATHYHTLAVNPAWGPKLVKAAIIGAHIFYRMPFVAGTPVAFRNLYRGGEPVPAPKTPLERQIGTQPVIAAIPPYQQPIAPPAPLQMQAAAAAPVWQSSAGTPRAAAPRTPVANIQPGYVRSGDSIKGTPGANISLPDDSQILPQYRDSGTWIK